MESSSVDEEFVEAITNQKGATNPGMNHVAAFLREEPVGLVKQAGAQGKPVVVAHCVGATENIVELVAL